MAQTDDRSAICADRILSHFRHVVDSGMAEAQIIDSPPKGEVFYDLIIEGIRFRGLCTIYGPWIERLWDASRSACVQLGVASVSRLDNRPPIRGKSLTEGQPWSVCKYRQQPRISLDDLSARGRARLAVEFGLPINDFEDGYEIDEAQSFYASPAFQALMRWADKHPRLAARASSNGHYLRGWSTVLQSPPEEDSALVA